MEVNKEQAEKCRDLGATALKNGDFERACKFLQKSLKLYPLPGVDALLSHAYAELAASMDGESNGSRSVPRSRSSSTRNAAGSNRQTQRSTSTASSTGADGRAYTEEQARVVKEVLRAKEGGRGAHYRVLKLEETCAESDIKKAYRKLSLKVHPDKNSAPHADEAFKAVGLAYATLSDRQKRTIYDRYGQEDPDNRGGGARGPVYQGQDVSPEEIFNMFFGGQMPGVYGGGPGFHVYTTGFGPDMQFRAGGNRRQRRGEAQRQQQQEAPGFGILLQLLPILLIMLVSFFRIDDHQARAMPGEGKYFSMTHRKPFVNPLKTRLSTVKEIPYFVTDRFLRTYYRDRYQLGQVERMVERAYEQFLVAECDKQRDFKKRLKRVAERKDEPEKQAQKQKAYEEYELTRCLELFDLYPHRQQRQQRQR